MVSASIRKNHYETLITSGHKKMIVDEPLDKGGKDLGMSPMELLASALASCVAITLRMYADQKSWPLDQVFIEVSIDAKAYAIEKEIALVGDLNAEQIQRLKEIADKCPVNKMLSNANTINTKVSWKKL
nr:OsmC family protein [Pseudopedobacter sp.]